MTIDYDSDILRDPYRAWLEELDEDANARKGAAKKGGGSGFDESEHPREKTGQFADKGGSDEKPSGGKSKTSGGSSFDEEGGIKPAKVKHQDLKEGYFYVDANILARSRALALEKADKAHVPTKTEAAVAKAKYKELGADSVERNARGSSADRRRRKQRLADEFGDGNGCACIYCGVYITKDRIEADRIHPGSKGGSYRYDNVVPADSYCNKVRSDTSFSTFKNGWKWPPAEPQVGQPKKDSRAMPEAGTICSGVEYVRHPEDGDWEPRHVEGPIQTRYVEVMDFTQVVIDGAVIDPDTLKVVDSGA